MMDRMEELRFASSAQNLEACGQVDVGYVLKMLDVVALGIIAMGRDRESWKK